jgi:hypothetical protein
MWTHTALEKMPEKSGSAKRREEKEKFLRA